MPVCIAVFPDGCPCRVTASAGSRWCSLHEEQQAKTFKAYKRYTAAFAEFDETKLCNTEHQMEECRCLERLIEYQRASREKWRLADRVIQSRAIHHARFCQGGDQGHQTFIDTLESIKETLEAQIMRLEARAYRLVLEREKADWLLDDGEDKTSHGGCEEYALSEPLDSPPLDSPGSSSPRSPSVSSAASSTASTATTSSKSTTSIVLRSVSQHCEEAESLRPSLEQALIARLVGHFHVGGSHSTQKYLQQVEVIASLFRFVVARNPSLLIKAQNTTHMPSDFVTKGQLSLEDLRCLEEGLQFGSRGLLSPHVLRNAITSYGRLPVEGEDKVQLLGGFWWRKPLRRNMTVPEWEIFHTHIRCSGCAMKVTRNFDEWMLWCQERWGSLHHFADAGTAFRDDRLNRLGAAIVRCSDDSKRTLERIQPKTRKMKPVFVERDARCWVFVRISHTQRAADCAITELCSDERFECLVQSNTELRPWTTRLRTGTSPASRREARWTADRHFCAPHAFDALAAGHFVGQSTDVLVLSARATLGEKIADFACQVAQVLETTLGGTK